MKQREIKFRAWGTQDHNRKMDYELEEATLCECGLNAMIRMMKEAQKKILMEYIGRSDKNGKEIYEGDIFRCNGGELPIEKCSIGEIMQSDLGWGAYLGNGCWAEQLENGEVIGNIFETPELLPK